MGLFEKALEENKARPGVFGDQFERRTSQRAPTLRSTYTAMTANRWDLELVPPIALDRLVDEIASLSERSLEPNIFFDSTVLRSAWPRLTSLLAPHGCWMLCLWETVNDKRDMRCFFPVGIAKTGWPGHRVLTPLANVFMPIGTPLLDKNCAGETAETLLRLLGDKALNLPHVIDLTYQREEGPTLAVLTQAAKSLGLEHNLNNRFQRATLLAPKDNKASSQRTLGKKRIRELARQMRLLEKEGDIEFICAESGNAVLDAFERFMTLELRSWKGRGGSALYNHKKIASFSRQIVAELAAKEQCQIYWLRQKTDTGYRMIAGTVLLGGSGHFVPWKMAFDETFSGSSPGMQVMVRTTQQLVQNKDFIAADSLAAPDHWMMNRIWPNRLAIADLTIALTTDGKDELVQTLKAKARYLQAYSSAKKAFGWIRKRFMK